MNLHVFDPPPPGSPRPPAPGGSGGKVAAMKFRQKTEVTAEQFDNNRFLRDRTLPAGCERRFGVDEEGGEYERRPVMLGPFGEFALDHGDWIVTYGPGMRRKFSDGSFQEHFEPVSG